jgi:hypothetical protein
MFEKASKAKLRFSTLQGVVTTEDLWDMSLTQLDELAKFLYNATKQEEISFLKEKPKRQSLLELRLNIVKHVINCKLEERSAAKLKAVKDDRRKLLLRQLENKQTEELTALSKEELLKELEELEGLNGYVTEKEVDTELL